MQNKAYIYTYDEYGRCTSAKVPGCEPSLTRYSRAGRVIAEHTPGMDAGKWLMHHYDACGREVLTTIASATEQQLRTVGAALPVATYDAAAKGAYGFSPALPMDVGTPQKAVFYDNYDFLGSASSMPAVGRTVRPLGLPAGSRDYVASTSGLTSALSYDADGFVAEEAAQTPFGTLHKSYTRDRQGAVLTETEDFTPQAGSKIRRVTANTYDAGGRITRRRITENGTTAETTYTYDMRGNLATETFGNRVKRRYSYDIHNWPVSTETDVPIKLIIGPIVPIHPITPQYYGALRPDSGRTIIPVKPAPTVETYTERLLYADGASPRYTGYPSARVNILGGRYDYRFDAHDRLVQADYTPGADAAKGEDFSVVYSYDAMARPTRVRRSGIIDMDADGNEKFGDLDILQYSYDQAGRVAAIDNDPEGVDYYGRPGFPSAGSEYDWDAAGRMTADTGRGISLIKYDHRNLPSKTTFDNGRTVTYSYDADGALIRSATRTLAVRPTLNPGKATVRTYAADRVWENNKLLYSYFPGGYFDADGHVHYLHNDYQGSVVLVTDSAGTVEQRNTYYPYGEPHRTPAGQPRLYAGKERMAVTGEYDYGARQHFAPGLLWSVPDAMAEKFYPISPYVFCNGNPIANVDPDGNSPTIIPALIGGGIGATLYSGVELVKQLFQDGPMDWSAVGGAAARGAVVGTVTGGTLGIGTSAAIAATTAANVAGGMADRAIQGEEVLSTEDIITDAAVGAASGAVGAVMGKAAEKVIDKASPAWKGKVGEKMTQIKYELKGNKVEGRNFEVDAGYKTPIRGKQATAKYDFNFKNRFTGKQIIRESKFNTADYTKNQRLAIKNCPYDFDKDVNTSKDLGQWVRASYSAYPALTPSK